MPYIDGNKVKTLRKKRQWTQFQLAALSGLSERTVIKIQNSPGTNFDEDTAKALASVFELSSFQDITMPMSPKSDTPGLTFLEFIGLKNGIKILYGFFFGLIFTGFGIGFPVLMYFMDVTPIYPMSRILVVVSSVFLIGCVLLRRTHLLAIEQHNKYEIFQNKATEEETDKKESSSALWVGCLCVVLFVLGMLYTSRSGAPIFSFFASFLSGVIGVIFLRFHANRRYKISSKGETQE